MLYQLSYVGARRANSSGATDSPPGVRARPGARRDTIDIYIKRLEKLEKIAKSFEGVERSYAVQAGREIRIVVQPQVLDDAASAKLARDIATRIESELEYPGQIKVTVVRETRATEFAK